MGEAPPARRLTDGYEAGTLIETKGFIVSENQIPSPGDESPIPSPPPPAAPEPAGTATAPTLPAIPTPPATQPPQGYPGAAPTYGTPVQPPYGTPTQPPYGVQPGYTPPTAPTYGAQPVPPGYAAYSAPGYPAAAPRPTSGLAVTSLICGIAGIVLFWAVVPLLASIAAVITGHMALGQTKREPRISGRGMAIAGLIMGYAGVAIAAFTVLSFIIGLIFFGAFSVPYFSAR